MGTVSPDVIEPINTEIGPYVYDSCFMYAEFGNYDSVAFGKSLVDGPSSCFVSDYIVAYLNGNYADGPIVDATSGAGWTNPQSTVPGYVVLSEYVATCGPGGDCNIYEFDAV